MRISRGGMEKSGPIVYRATSGRFEVKVWIETDTEGRRRFMAALRKEEVDAARHRQGKLLSRTEAKNFSK